MSPSNQVKYILTDIEGTTSDIRFVKETLFPYAYQHLPSFVQQNHIHPAVRVELTSAALELGCNEHALEEIIEGMLEWIQSDQKKTSLKSIQGQIWRKGYLSGDFTGHLYPDAEQWLRVWSDAGLQLGVYSSGSVEAQQLLFGYSDFGDLRPLFHHYFDTRVGHKRVPASYEKIRETLSSQGVIADAGEVLFLSDVVEELDAAASVGMQTAELRRDQHESSPHHRSFDSFGQVDASFQLRVNL